MAEIKGSQQVLEKDRISSGLNIGFKIGAEQALKDLPKEKIQAGVFYLTNDTHRLYIGNKDGSISPVNQGVIPVSNLNAITNPVPGQFYYISGTNILATWSGDRWVQINPDTYIDNMTTEVSTVTAVSATSNGKVKIVHDIEQTGGIDNHIKNTTTAVNIEGGQKVYVQETDANNIKISTGDYGVKTAGSKNAVNVVLTYTPDGGTAADEEKLTLKPTDGSLMEITQTNNVISFNTTPIQNVVSDQNIESAAFSTGSIDGTSKEGFTLTLTKGDNSTVKAHVDPKVTYGKADYGTGQHTHSFSDGVETLHVYTIEQTDKLISDSLTNFNALTYRGTVGSTGATVNALPQKNVENGDVYMGDGTIKVKLTANGAEVLYDAGTLFIARGDEGVDGKIPENQVTWTRVDNYNADTITNMNTGVAKKISFHNSIVGGARDGATDQLGSLTVDASGVLTATDVTTGTDKVITITHNPSPFEKTATVELQDGGVTQTLFSGKALGTVSVDTYGHVQTMAEVNITVPTEVFSESESVSAVTITESGDKDTAVFSDTISLINSDNEGTVTSVTLKNQISSETLQLTKDGDNTMKMNLVWGTF